MIAETLLIHATNKLPNAPRYYLRLCNVLVNVQMKLFVYSQICKFFALYFDRQAFVAIQCMATVGTIRTFTICAMRA